VVQQSEIRSPQTQLLQGFVSIQYACLVERPSLFERTTVMVLLEFSMSPLEQGPSVGGYVARSLEIIDKSGLDYRLHAMGTIIEGDIDQVLAVLKKCLEAMAADCDRITCTAKLDYRKGFSGRLKTKVASVEEKLGRTLKKVD
jgi:uncharacterized protein (TIGR00106 family)